MEKGGAVDYGDHCTVVSVIDAPPFSFYFASFMWLALPCHKLIECVFEGGCDGLVEHDVLVPCFTRLSQTDPFNTAITKVDLSQTSCRYLQAALQSCPAVCYEADTPSANLAWVQC